MRAGARRCVAALPLLGGVALTAIVLIGAIAPPAEPSIDSTNPALVIRNGVVIVDNRLFTGHVLEHDANGHLKRNAAYRHGRLDGTTRGWYANGRLDYIRAYRGGREEGTHRGWYENGAPRFHYRFRQGLSEGVQQQWYATGQPYTRFHFEQGQESGQQQMWNSDGTLRANYVIRNGRRYGLPGSVGCRGVS